MSMFETLLGVSEAERDEFLRQFDADPYPFYRAMREMGPVVQDPVLGIFHVTHRDLIEEVLKNPAVYSSAANEPLVLPFFGVNMLHLDGDGHTRLRGLVSASFTPAAIAAYAAQMITPLCDATIDEMRGRATSEFCQDFCIRFPLRVIARMLNVPMRDFGRFSAWYTAIVDAMRDFPKVTEKHALGVKAAEELGDYLRPIVRERMQSPTPRDLVGHLSLTEIDGERLTEDEIINFGKQLLFAGAETTQRLLATTLYGILSTGALDRVRGNDALIESAIEEGLRWVSPAQTIVRSTTCDAVLGGVEVPKGAVVSLAIAAAHRDPAFYDDPDTFRAERKPVHFAFGGGRHICLGAYLARAEAKIGLTRFLDAFPRVRLDPHHEVQFRGMGLRSPAALHLLLED